MFDLSFFNLELFSFVLFASLPVLFGDIESWLPDFGEWLAPEMEWIRSKIADAANVIYEGLRQFIDSAVGMVISALTAIRDFLKLIWDLHFPKKVVYTRG
jgi:hypothetical protein